MQAMATIGFSASLESEVTERLGVLQPQVQHWAFDFLGQKGAPLQDDASVWALAADASASAALRARAVYCLEQTKAIPDAADARQREVEEDGVDAPRREYLQRLVDIMGPRDHVPGPLRLLHRFFKGSRILVVIGHQEHLILLNGHEKTIPRVLDLTY